MQNFGFTSYVPLDVWVNGGSDERQALAFFDPNVNLPTVQSGLLPGHSFKKKKRSNKNKNKNPFAVQWIRLNILLTAGVQTSAVDDLRQVAYGQSHLAPAL